MAKRTMILILLLLLTPVAFAADLPIDIETIRRQGEEQQGALTARWHVDLFSESADATTEAIARRQERELAEIEQSLFTQPHAVYATNPYEMILNDAIEAQLFSTPMQIRPFTETEEETGIPLWVMISVLAGAAGLGLLITIKVNAKRKGRAVNVHHHHR